MKKNKKLYVVLIGFIILITACSITKLMQNDTFFTIATGREIINNGYDNIDHLTWHEGLSFYKLRWAFDVTIATLFNNFGFTGIYVFIILIAVITMILLFFTLVKKKNSVLLSFIGTMCSALLVTSVGTFTGRAQIISYLLLLWEIFVLERLISTNKKRYFVYLFIISVLIVNFHASVWMMTIILILPYLAEAIINKFVKKQIRITTENIEIKSLIIAIIILFLGSFISPIGIYTYSYMFKVMGGLSTEFIAELQTSNILQSIGMSVMLVIYTVIALSTKTKIKVRDLCLFFGLFIMAVLARRNQTFLFIIGMIPLVDLVNEFFVTYDNEHLLDKLTTKITKTKSLIIIALLIIVMILPSIVRRVKEDYVDKSSYPVDATEFIKNNLDYENMRIFNHFNFGSYLELNGIKAFVDSRSEIFCEEFNNTEVLQDWLDVYECKVHYDDIFDKYNIDYALVYNTERINTYLNKDVDYTKLYEDDYFSIYERK